MHATSPDQRVSCVCAGVQLCIGAVWRFDWLHLLSASDSGILCADNNEANSNLTLTGSEMVGHASENDGRNFSETLLVEPTSLLIGR